MQHTYLRYECADSFGLITSSASSKAPQSNNILAFGSATRAQPVLLTTAGSQCMGFHLRKSTPTIKIGHREQLSGGVGTGQALNSDQIVCLDVSNEEHGDICRVATGWVDGAVRVFDVYDSEMTAEGGCALVQSLLQQDSVQDDFLSREPLLLNGHSGSPIRSIAFDKNTRSRLASGSSDGAVVLWDVVAESGLFRLLGHKGGISDIHFVQLQDSALDLLISSSLDGFIKVWDLKGQCCIQTIPANSGEIWGASCIEIPAEIRGGEISPAEPSRVRLVTGSNDGLVRVWDVRPSKRVSRTQPAQVADGVDHAAENDGDEDVDNVCDFMGKLIPAPNVATSSERISCIHPHPNGKYIGVLRSNSNTVDVYLIRSVQETLRRKQRRLRRRKGRPTNEKPTDSTTNKGTKRGMLDDPVSDDDKEPSEPAEDQEPSHDSIKASDEFEYFGTVRAGHKIKGFIFVPYKESGGGVRIVCSLTTNSLETLSLTRKKSSDGSSPTILSNRVSTLDMAGHPTGIRAVELSSDDTLACTISKKSMKVWNVAKRSCIQSLSPSIDDATCYGLCSVFLPGNSHVVVGTREGHLLVVDIAAGEVVFSEEKAHDGAVWSIDVRRPTDQQPAVSLVTGSADKTVKFWDVEVEEESESMTLAQTRTLEMSDDVVAVRYSNSSDPKKRMVFVSALDSTIKVFFDDTLKFFLSLYGHKLPALAVDASDDDTILASSGADKTIKIWGLDFGDTHRTLHGHEDSVTDLRFVRRTHNFFTSSKDGTVRYWDGDRFEQILLLNGHFAEVSALAISRSGGFLLSAGMDRQVRVWERTKDIVFLEEERERELEQVFDKVSGQEDLGTSELLKDKTGDDDGSDDEGAPQSAAAVRKSLMSISGGDRLREALERADHELKEIASARVGNAGKERSPNPFLLGMEPPQYILWVLKSIKNTELEQSLLVLPQSHVQRVLYYLVKLLQAGQGIEICARVAIFVAKAHQNLILMNQRSIATPLRELRRLLRLRLAEYRDSVGYNLASFRAIAQQAANQKDSALGFSEPEKDIWAGLGLGSDLAAAIEGRKR